MSLRTTLVDAAVAFVREAAEPRSIDEIVEYVIEAHRDQVEKHVERAFRAYVRSIIKGGLSDKPAAESQPILPGFHIPATITIPIDESGRVGYVVTEKATETQWRAHRVMKIANIARATEELSAYHELTDRLATVWKTAPTLTVGECIQRLAEELS